MNLSDWQKEIGQLMAKKGFHDLPRSETVPVQLWVEQRLMRTVGELSEVAEIVKKKFSTSATDVSLAAGDSDFEKLAEELADVVYRVLDIAYLLDVDVGKAILKKHNANSQRPQNYGTSDEAKV